MAAARAAYPSDLSDGQWAFIEPLIPEPKTGARPHTVDVREVVNGILYVLRTACSWRQLPHDLPPWGTVYWYFWTFRREGVWEKIHNALREKMRVKEGREPTPSGGIVDSQRAKTTGKGAPNGPSATTTRPFGARRPPLGRTLGRMRDRPTTPDSRHGGVGWERPTAASGHDRGGLGGAASAEGF